ncbi:MAG: V4R domain-containing protein [Candidatus Helarchaeota archaeon]
MNRMLLEHMLTKMKEGLKKNESIGNLKIGALFALGSQLEAIFYFVGHELGSKFECSPAKNSDELISQLVKISEEYNIGKFKVVEQSEDHITFNLESCNSCKDFPDDFTSDSPFCSFEAGLYAGIVEKITNKHCFAQELSCRLQKGGNSCQFMIVIPQTE